MKVALVLAGVLASLAGASLAAGEGADASKSASGHTGPRPPAFGRVVHATVSAAPAQTIEGFGASGDWWPIDLHHFPNRVQRLVAALLFSSKGIMLSHYRYNIGGGGVGVDRAKPGQSQLGSRSRAPASMYVAPGVYDWSQDPGGTTFLRYAAQYHVPDIEANVNSAPWVFTTNRRSCGGQLRRSAIGAYVRYLVAVVRHARQAWHATLSYVSPMNEPDYKRADCTQEGMQVRPRERAVVVRTLARAFRQMAPYAKVVADESSRVATQLLPQAPQWLSLPGTAPSLGALATHAYDFPSDGTLAQAAALARHYRKPLWMTEICCMVGPENDPREGAGYDPTMTGALPMAYLIWQDLTYGLMRTWDWWGAASPAMGCDPARSRSCATRPNSVGYNRGLLYYDPNFSSDHDYTIYTTKRFWTMGNFSRFVRPGAVRHAISGGRPRVDLLAFASGHRWELVAIDERLSGSTRMAVRFPSGAELESAGAYRTSRRNDLSPVAGAVKGPGAALTVSLPPQSVTTYLFQQASWLANLSTL